MSRERAEYKFTRVPRDLGPRWNLPTVTTFMRGLALQTVHLADGLEWACEGEWEVPLCRALGVHGPERPAALKALRKLVEVGLLEPFAGGVRVVLGPSTVEVRSGHGRGTVPVRSSHGPSTVEVRSGHGRGTVEGRIASSNRKHANHVSQTDRLDRGERETEPARAPTRTHEEPFALDRDPPEADREPGEPDPLPEPREPFDAFVRRAWVDRFERATTTPPILTPDNRALLAELASWLESTQGADPQAACARLLDAFFADPWVQSKRYPLRNLVNQATRYLGAAEFGGASTYEALCQQQIELLKAGKVAEAQAMNPRIAEEKKRRAS